jgi:hypothetical protein
MANVDEQDLAPLRRLAGRMIPASAKHDAPGADDERIFADIVETLRAKPGVLEELLQGLAASGPDAPPPPALIVAVAQCYYRDDRVMRSLGMEPRPPFPKGYEVEEGDWSLTDPVKARPALWRQSN